MYLVLAYLFPDYYIINNPAGLPIASDIVIYEEILEMPSICVVIEAKEEGKVDSELANTKSFRN